MQEFIKPLKIYKKNFKSSDIFKSKNSCNSYY